MHFELPANLRVQVAAYDPVLKPLIAQQNKENAKRNTAPLGLPDDLLPIPYVSQEQQLQIAKEINTLSAEDRAIVGENEYLNWIVMHHENVWLAQWFFKPGEYNRPNCVYGATVAFKAAPSTLKKVSRMFLGAGICNITDETAAVSCKYGKTQFYRRGIMINKKMICDGLVNLPSNLLLGNWGRRSHDKRQQERVWTQALAETIPTWKDASLFSRIREGDNITACIFENINQVDKNCEFNHELIARFSGINEFPRLQNTPYFRREIAQTITKSKELYNDPVTNARKDVRAPVIKFCHKLRCLKEFLEFYPDASLDYCQKVFELAEYHHNLGCRSEWTHAWIRENMPISSFVGIIEKSVSEFKEEWAEDPRKMQYASTSWGGHAGYIRDLDDTLSMIGVIYSNSDDPQLSRPSRWRLAEFHDHVAAEAFKVRNPNEKLRQDLFPEPVRVDHLGQRWTFIQPQDVHQLAAWGQAVRNCVGSASSYKEGIKKRTHFIVLAMIDNKPRFTIQLKVRNGLMSVEQIADVANRRLKEDEKSMYELTFGAALKMQDQRLSESQK